MHIDREPTPAEQVPPQRSGAFSIPRRLPVFPLPNVVLFPKTYVPLHIFEPRYRQMVADAARGGRSIAMALLKEGWESNYYGNPAIYSTLCVGRLISVQPLPEGRSNILLQGLACCDIEREHFEKPYREAIVRLKPWSGEERLAPGVRRSLLGMLERYLQTREDSEAWRGFFREDVTDEVLVNTLSIYLECTPLEKQFLLEAGSLRQRAQRLNDLIQFMLHDRYGTKGWE